MADLWTKSRENDKIWIYKNGSARGFVIEADQFIANKTIWHHTNKQTRYEVIETQNCDTIDEALEWFKMDHCQSGLLGSPAKTLE